jgi:zinc transporter
MSAVPIAASSPPPRVDGFGVVPGIIWAFRIHEDGTAEALPVDKPIENRHDGWLWLHLK